MEALLTTSTLIFVLVSATFLLSAAWFIYAGSGTPSSPPAWPIIGHLHLFSGSDLLHRKFARLADEFGPVLRLRAGFRAILLVSSVDAARECFTTHDRAFASRPRTAAGRILGNDSLGVPWAPYGPLWRGLRKISTLELFSHRRLHSQARFRDEETSALVSSLFRATSESVVVAPNTIRIKDHLLRMVMRLVLRVVGGGRDQAGFVNAETTRELLELVETAFYYSGVPVLGDWFPFLKWVDWKGTQKAMREVVGKINALARSWLEERRKMLYTSTGSGDINREEAGGDLDFMDVLISMADGDKIECLKELAQERKDLAVYSLLETVVFAAIDTTALTLEWLMAELLNQPRLLEKAQQELGLKVGNQRRVEEKDIEELPYLQAIVKETLRLHPAGPLLVPHESTEACVVAGSFHVPAGTQLIVNAWKIHRDPNYWPHPLKFDPERFLGPEGSAADVDLKGQHFQFIPFGSGRRACPGAQLAPRGLSLLSLCFTSLLRGCFMPSTGACLRIIMAHYYPWT